MIAVGASLSCGFEKKTGFGFLFLKELKSVFVPLMLSSEHPLSLGERVLLCVEPLSSEAKTSAALSPIHFG